MLSQRTLVLLFIGLLSFTVSLVATLALQSLS